MNAPFAAFALLFAALPFFASGPPGTLALEHELLFSESLLYSLADDLFARPLFVLVPRRALSGAPLSTLVRHALALDPFVVARIHQQPLAEAVRSGNAEPRDHSR